MEPLGTQIRRNRRRLGLTLDELSGRTGISKPYLSLIETGRVLNPPSDDKLRRLEQTLGFPPGALIRQAHLQRTPRDVRAMLNRLLQQQKPLNTVSTPEPMSSSRSTTVDLDHAYLSGILQELVDHNSGNVEQVTINAVPVINKVSAGYPEDFTDLSYPRGVADDYIGCPDLHDRDAFACRVFGDSMIPKFRQGDIVIFSPAAVPKDGDDCFVRFKDGHTTFKRVFFELDEQGRSVIRLQPRNERYRPQIVEAEQVTGLYKAMYRYQLLDSSEDAD